MKEKTPTMKNYGDDIFQKRLSEKYDEIYSLYSTIYHDDKMFESMIDTAYNFYKTRSNKLKKLDDNRLKQPHWYCNNDSIGFQCYADKFAGSIRGIETKLDYLQNLGIKFIHIFPFLRSPSGKSDGGFACSDYRNVREDLGTIDDLEHLINSLHDRGMCFAMDFILNHTSDEHEWAKRAKKGEIEYQNRYYFYDSWYEPNQFDSYGVMGHFFGDLAPDNFTFVPECQKIVMTTFYPYQWDLNFSNPIVFNEQLSNILYLMNLGVDLIIFNATSNVWKKPGTSCRNLPQSYIINQIIDNVMKIVCPGGAASFDMKRHKKRTNNIQLSTSNVELAPKNDNENSFTSDKNENNQSAQRSDKTENVNDDQIDNESESENEKEFIITESGVMTVDTAEDILLMKKFNKVGNDDENDDEIELDVDISTEIGKVHYNIGWISRLWASLSFGDAYPILYSINAISNRYAGDCYTIHVHTHDDINWGFGFDVENNSYIGNGKCIKDGFRGGIISVYRYLNDFYSGKIHGSFSRGKIFAEDLVTGKARICGSTASLLGLESSLRKEAKLKQKIEIYQQTNVPKMLIQKLNIARNGIQTAIDRILFLYAVTGSMPSIFNIYFGDEIGQMNDYDFKNHQEYCSDIRYLHRCAFDWESVKLIDSDKDSYQSKIFNGIKNLIYARRNCPFFTENERTVFIKNYTLNEYFNDVVDDKVYINKENAKYDVDNTLLIFKRIRKNGKFLLFIFNFRPIKRHVHIDKNDIKGKFKELITGEIFNQVNDFMLKGYGYLWLEPVEE